MKYNQYKQLATRTRKDLGNHKDDVMHMMVGFASESLDELSDAMTNQDVVNLKEEYGDIA